MPSDRTLISPDDVRPTWSGTLPPAATNVRIGEGDVAAEAVQISPRTVDFHKKELKKDLGVGSTPELVQQAVRLGIIHPGD